MFNRIYQIFRIVAVCFLFRELMARSEATEILYKKSKFLMGSEFTIAFPENPKKVDKAELIINEAFSFLEKLESEISSWSNDSLTTKINNNVGKFTEITPRMHRLLSESISYSRLTDGAFDVTAGVLFTMWEKARRDKQLPSEADLKLFLKSIGHKNIILQPDRIKLAHPSTRIGFGAIGKGFAADLLKEEFIKKGINNFIIDAGGDVTAHGRFGLRKWQIAIKNPLGEGFLGHLEAKDISVATSGNYERNFKVEGKKYGHIINPKTGFPIDHIASASVFSSKGSQADALATAISVLPPKEGIQLINRLENVEAIIVDAKGRVYLSQNIKLSKTRKEITISKGL